MGLLDIGSFFTGLIINLLLISLICYYFKRKYENLEESLNEQAKILYELLERDKSIKDDTIEKIYNNEITNDCNTVVDSQLETDKEDDDDDDDDDDDFDDIEGDEKDGDDDDDGDDDEKKDKKVVNEIILTPTNIETSGIKYVEINNMTTEKETQNTLDIKVIKDIDTDNTKEQQEITVIEDSIIKESIVIQNDIECPIIMDTIELNENVNIEKEIVEDKKDVETPYIKNNKEVDSEIEIPDEEDEYEIYDESNPNNNYNKMSVKELRNILSNKGVNVSSKMKKNELLSLIQGKKSLIIDMALEDN